jgi:predicted permease
MSNLRYALRTIAAAPGFTVAAVLSLALGIGANSAIFSVASALLLRPLPYQDPDRLAILWNRSPGLGITEDWFSTAQYFDIKTRNDSFEQVAIAFGANVNLIGDGPPERVGTIRVSSNLLPMLGVVPAHGRFFTPEEDVQQPSTAAMLSHGFFVRRYGGDTTAIGRAVILNGQTARIVGVLPPTFSLRKEVMPTLGVVTDADILVPLPLGADAPTVRTREDYNILAKLKSGVGVEQAQADMDRLTARLRTEHPDVYPANGGLTFSVIPLQEQVVGDIRRSLLVLVGAVACVLLISCANVANLFLSRALARRKEIAVRAALGATRGRVVRQLLCESLLLSLSGGAVGLLFAGWSLDAIAALGTKSIPRLHEISIDARVLLFTLLVSCVAGVLFGLVPAWRLGQADLQQTLSGSGRGAATGGTLWGRGRSARRLLVVGEIALAVMLLIGAGLLLRSFSRLQDVRPGFDPAAVLTLELTTTGQRYTKAEAVVEAYRLLWTRLRALPGVSAAGGVSALPLSDMMSWGPITVEGRVPPPGEKFINVDQRMVGGDYFQAMRIPLIRGRVFTEQDTRTQPRVVVVDDHMAQQLWPGTDPIGRRIRLGPDGSGAVATVVGVVGRIKQDRLESDSRMAMYVAHTQFSTRAMNIVVRASTADPAVLTSSVTEQIRALDPDLPIYNVRPMTDRVNESLARRRFAMMMLTCFALLALGLAVIGIYGVVAYFVGQSTRELGIRLALGATPRRILLTIVRHSTVLAATGIATGLGGALVLTPLMQSLLFGIRATDPLTFGGIALLLGLVAVAATFLPARRASRIDPIVSLRAD